MNLSLVTASGHLKAMIYEEPVFIIAPANGWRRAQTPSQLKSQFRSGRDVPGSEPIIQVKLVMDRVRCLLHLCEGAQPPLRRLENAVAAFAVTYDACVTCRRAVEFENSLILIRNTNARVTYGRLERA
jgi:hypothetical protein